MTKQLMSALALVSVLLGPSAARALDCTHFEISQTLFDATNATTVWVAVGTTAPLAVSFEPDYSGIETGAAVSMKMCQTKDATNACLDYNYDSNGDGVTDTNILDGSSTEKSGVTGVFGFNYLLLTVSTAGSATAEPRVTVCRGAR